VKLTHYTDYAIRVVVHLATHCDRLSSIAEIAKLHAISRNHLMKVVQDLGASGYVETLRGRNGGIRLAKPAELINLGALIRHTETSFQLLDWSDCILAPSCSAPNVLAEATQAFLSVLDRHTVADLLRKAPVRDRKTAKSNLGSHAASP
jgi:Rrf2 family nitric oxide-sensitive transcriptional repressor